MHPDARNSLIVLFGGFSLFVGLFAAVYRLHITNNDFAAGIVAGLILYLSIAVVRNRF